MYYNDFEDTLEDNLFIGKKITCPEWFKNVLGVRGISLTVIDEPIKIEQYYTLPYTCFSRYSYSEVSDFINNHLKKPYESRDGFTILAIDYGTEQLLGFAHASEGDDDLQYNQPCIWLEDLATVSSSQDFASTSLIGQRKSLTDPSYLIGAIIMTAVSMICAKILCYLTWISSLDGDGFYKKLSMYGGIYSDGNFHYHTNKIDSIATVYPTSNYYIERIPGMVNTKWNFQDHGKMLIQTYKNRKNFLSKVAGKPIIPPIKDKLIQLVGIE